MTDYNATIELGRGRGDSPDDIIDKLTGHGPVVSPLTRGRWELIITLPAASLGTAATTAIALAAGATSRPVIAITVMTTAEYDRRVQTDDDQPADEVTVTQAAEKLGVCRQRIHQMIAEGKLPARKVGQRGTLIPASAVLR